MGAVFGGIEQKEKKEKELMDVDKSVVIVRRKEVSGGEKGYWGINGNRKKYSNIKNKLKKLKNKRSERDTHTNIEDKALPGEGILSAKTLRQQCAGHCQEIAVRLKKSDDR